MPTFQKFLNKRKYYYLSINYIGLLITNKVEIQINKLRPVSFSQQLVKKSQNIIYLNLTLYHSYCILHKRTRRPKSKALPLLLCFIFFTFNLLWNS
jgi:hypothetical protein